MAFATGAVGEDELDGSWPLLVAALADGGARACTVDWSASPKPGAKPDLAVVAFAWDYVTDRDRFLAWAGSAATATQVLNPPAALRWNTHKRYLADLAADGIPTVPTAWIDPGQGWRPPSGDFVVKPAVASGSLGVARYHDTSADRRAAGDHVAGLHAAGQTVLVQPFQPAVDADGETALVYFAGCFSHAARKRVPLEAGAGVVDELWRQEVATPDVPRVDQRTAADAALAAAGARVGPSAYARVDLVDGPDGAPLVLEVELVEPSLFLTFDPAAPGRFARALLPHLPTGS